MEDSPVIIEEEIIPLLEEPIREVNPLICALECEAKCCKELIREEPEEEEEEKRDPIYLQHVCNIIKEYFKRGKFEDLELNVFHLSDEEIDDIIELFIKRDYEVYLDRHVLKVIPVEVEEEEEEEELEEGEVKEEEEKKTEELIE